MLNNYQKKMKIQILKMDKLNAEIQTGISELFQQLNPNQRQISSEEIFTTGNQITFVYCQEDNGIVGIASICSYQAISGHKGWIEDVVVDINFRGKGVGRKLIYKLLEIGKEKRMTEILLFTADHRIPAINLYKSIGFEIKDSRIYVLKGL